MRKADLDQRDTNHRRLFSFQTACSGLYGANQTVLRFRVVDRGKLQNFVRDWIRRIRTGLSRVPQDD